VKKNKYPWPGCGASKDITGCRFSVSPMSNNYVNMLLDSIKSVNTEKVWSATDKTSTVYRGKRVHVLDCVKACFSNIHNGFHPYNYGSDLFKRMSRRY
jgi:hypothetical protein